MQSFILEQDVQEVVLRLMAPKKNDTKELRTISDYENKLYWWKQDDYEAGKETFQTEPLFLVKWHQLSYKEVSWEPMSLILKHYANKMKRFFKNFMLKQTMDELDKSCQNNMTYK